MTLPRTVHLAGLGLSCALGRGLDESVRALRRGPPRSVRLRLTGHGEELDLAYFPLTGGETDRFDPSRWERLLPAVVTEALDQAGVGPAGRAGLPLYVGSTAFGVSGAEEEYNAALGRPAGRPLPMPRVGFQCVSECLGDALGLGGPDFVFNTACTASANALLAACRAVGLGHTDRALVVGMEIANRTTLAGFGGLQLLADELKPFDKNRGGIVLGEAMAAVVLSSGPAGLGLSLAGGACNSDPFSVTTANPDGGSIAALLGLSLASCGVDPSAVRGVKAHGTASPRNDSGEAAGLRRVFPVLPPLTALKPYLGHTLGACGAVELALLAGALGQGFLPRVPGFEHEDPVLGVRPLTREAPAPAGHYLLNYFGFGGSNTALLLEKR